MVTRILPEQAYLRECFEYDPGAGTLHWRERPRSHFSRDLDWKGWNKRYAGTIAGNPGPDGYRRIYVSHRPHTFHRIIWMLVTGRAPTHQIDHKNRDKTDNSWDNLREATPSQNRSNNTCVGASGLKGAVSKRNKFEAAMSVGGKKRYLGTFATPEEAHAAYCAAAKAHYGEFWYDGHS